MKQWLKRLIPYATHIGSLLPLVWLVVDGFTHHLTANPIQAITQRTGQIAIILLLVSLAITPINYFLHLPILSVQRRALGLYAFLYTMLHFLNYIGLDYGFAWGTLWNDFIQKRFLFVGVIALIIITPLAVTSLNWWQKKMGKKWKLLHRLVYGVGVLAVLHYAWSRKGDLFRFSGDVFFPQLALLILFALLFLRLPPIHRWISRHPGTR
jgi:methionine sulfoxide reductase heme-binding subunit